MKDILNLFRESGLGVRVFKDMASTEKWLASQKPEAGVLCPYQGNYRLISEAVCNFHKEKKDSECESCQPKGGYVNSAILGRYILMKNSSVKDAADLAPGRYVPDGHGGWKFKARLTSKERFDYANNE